MTEKMKVNAKESKEEKRRENEKDNGDNRGQHKRDNASAFVFPPQLLLFWSPLIQFVHQDKSPPNQPF